jgi:hypothetical protein
MHRTVSRARWLWNYQIKRSESPVRRFQVEPGISHRVSWNTNMKPFGARPFRTSLFNHSNRFFPNVRSSANVPQPPFLVPPSPFPTSQKLPVDVVLVRHGESEGNFAQKFSKVGDHSYWTPEFSQRHTSQYRLTDKGRYSHPYIVLIIRKQAQIAGDWLKANIAGEYYTSGKFFWTHSDRVRSRQRNGRFAEPSERPLVLRVLLEGEGQGDHQLQIVQGPNGARA